MTDPHGRIGVWLHGHMGCMGAWAPGWGSTLHLRPRHGGAAWDRVGAWLKPQKKLKTLIYIYIFFLTKKLKGCVGLRSSVALLHSGSKRGGKWREVAIMFG